MKLLLSLISILTGIFTGGCEQDVSQLGEPEDTAKVISIKRVLLLPRLGNPAFKVAPDNFDPNTTRKIGPRKTISKPVAADGLQIQLRRENGETLEVLQPYKQEHADIENGDTVKLYRQGVELRAYK